MVKQEYQEQAISVNAAAKKYLIPQSTLARWAAQGRIRVLVRPERHGQKMLVDEASVVLARQAYTPYWRGEGLNLPLPAPENSPVPVVEPKLNTADLAEKYHHYGETIGFKPLTLEKNRHHLRLFAESCPAVPLTPEPILHFLHDLPVGMRTKKSYYEVIRAFYNYLVDFHSITTPLTSRMVPRVERHPYFRVLSREDVSRVLDAAGNFKETMILKTLYATRVRVGELVSMTSDNLYPDKIVVTGKTGTWEVPISAELYQELQLLGEGSLFRDRSGKPITRDGVRHRVEKCMRSAGITGKKLGPHTFRHTSLTHLYEDTGDLPLVQEAAHHTDMKTTMIYTHPRAAKQRDKLLRHDPLKRLTAKPEHTPTDDELARIAVLAQGED